MPKGTKPIRVIEQTILNGILERILTAYEVDLEQIKSLSRKKKIAEPRGILMYALILYGYTLKQAANFCGRSNHSTAIHHRDYYRDWEEVDLGYVPRSQRKAINMIQYYYRQSKK